MAFGGRLAAFRVWGRGEVDGAVAGLDRHDTVFGVFACRLEQASANAALGRGGHGKASWCFRGVLGFGGAGSGADAAGFDLDSIITGLPGPAGEVGGAEMFEVIAINCPFWSALVGVARGAGRAAEVEGFFGGRAKFWVDAVSLDGVGGCRSLEGVVLGFLVVAEVDKILFVGSKRRAGGHNFAARYP